MPDGRPTKLDQARRERLFVVTLLETGSVETAATVARIKPARLARLLDRPDVRSVLAHTLEAAA